MVGVKHWRTLKLSGLFAAPVFSGGDCYLSVVKLGAP